MSFHTLIIGTSKSKNLDGYYFEARDKFWKLIHRSGLTPRQYNPEEYRLLQSQGIGFGELAFHHQVLGESSSTDVFSQAFNGKTAISAFFEFDETGNVESLNSQYVRNKGWEYGLCTSWKGIEVYMLPNLSATASAEWKKHDGELHWMKFWGIMASTEKLDLQVMKKEKPSLTPTQKLWAGLILFMFCIIAGLVYILITKDIIKH